MLAEVAAGLALPQKELPPKYFYDHRGSELFEEITRLPEYYLTRAERALLERWMPQLVPALGTRTLVELGAGSAEKSRIILDSMRAAGTAELYVPIDVSAVFLRETADRVRREYPGLAVIPGVADISEEVTVPRGLTSPVLLAFLRKDIGLIEAAYNDAQGITAEFNRNMLRVVNHELGANFDLEAFRHHAFYQREAHRIEMHLVSTRRQSVEIPGIGQIRFGHGESIRTEISCKYDIPSIAAMFSAAGLRLESWTTDPEQRFALVVGRPA
jgi:L-histidine N-alpha-methyltransferase